MFFYRNPVKMIYKSSGEEEVLQRLGEYLDSHMAGPAMILARLWKDQQAALSYREIREAIQSGTISEELIKDWMQDYSLMASKHFLPMWMQAAEVGGKGQLVTRSIPGYAFDPKEKGVRRWVLEHTGEFITAVSEEQKKAVQAMIGRTVDGRYTVDELSRIIRPCIGLNKPQAEANLRYYETVRDGLAKAHPKMRVEDIQKKAREKAYQYAERQHRQRAYMIAETELAAAYNAGSEQAVRQAQKQGKLGAVRRVGSTADDERVCRQCGSKHGREILVEEGTPPWHPRCRCAIAYEPTEDPFDPESVKEPDYVPIDEAVTEEAYEQIQREFALISLEHQDIIEKELICIRRSPLGNSRANKLMGCIEVADELEEGEFIHEAAHILEDYFQVYQNERFVRILKDAFSGRPIIRDTTTFTKLIYRVESPYLVSEYQGRAYIEYVPLEIDGKFNQYAYAEFFAEGYKYYVLNPGLLKQKNPDLFDYMEGLYV